MKKINRSKLLEIEGVAHEYIYRSLVSYNMYTTITQDTTSEVYRRIYGRIINTVRNRINEITKTSH
jgi:hypothetical protein